MASRNFSSAKDIKISVEDGQLVTLELNVRLTFALPAPIPIDQELANGMRLLNSELRHRVADELEQTWLGTGMDAEVPGPPPGNETVSAASPTPEAETASTTATLPPPFTPSRRNSQVALTVYQQIVRHLEGPRFGFTPEQRGERLLFTAWLTGHPDLGLSTTNDLRAEAAQKVLKRLASESAPADLLDDWHRTRPTPEQGPSPIYDEPLGF